MSKLKLVRTCWSCPEQYQYDVYRGQDLVGYLRLRHGHFRAECPKGTVVFEGHPQGDGSFLDDERDRYLTAACQAILFALAPSGPEDVYTIVEKEEDL